jgi:mRNA interferase RelE/StbE
MYEVYLERHACDDLQQLPKHVYNRAIQRVRRLSENPRPEGCRKLEGSINDWRLRVGDYRVIYEIDDSHKRVNVMRIKHRREAYR